MRLGMTGAVLALALCACGGATPSPRSDAVSRRVAAPIVTPFATAATLAFDPSNVTGCASDANSCTTVSCGALGAGPCLSFGEIARRYGSHEWAPQVAQTLWQLSSEPSSSTDPIVVTVYGAYASGFAFRGQPFQVATATVGTFTSLVRAVPGQPYQITASGQTGTYWTQYVGDLVNDTTTGAFFWVEKDLGSATARITTPLSTSVGSTCSLPSVLSVSPGDALVIYDLPKTNIGTYHVSGNALNYGPISRLRIVSAGSGGTSSIGSVGSTGGVSPCVIEVAVQATFLDMCRTAIFNSFLGGQGPFSGDVGGAVVTQTSIGCGATQPVGAGLSVLDGDVLLDTGTDIHLGAGVQFGNVYLGSGQTFDTDGMQGGSVTLGLYDLPGFYGTAILWGAGAVELHDGATFVCEHGCTGNLLVPLTIKGSGTAYPWNASTHAWGAPTSLSAANIDDAGVMSDITGANFYRTR